MEIEGVPQAALIFPMTLKGLRRTRLGQAVWLVALLVLAVVYVILLIRIGTRTDTVAQILRVFGLSMEVGFVGLAVWLIRSWQRPDFVALLREGIYSRSGLGPLLVPWAAIASVGLRSYGGRVVGLGIRVRGRLRLGPPLITFWRPFNRRLAGWDFIYPLTVMRSSAEFQRIVERCMADPAERSRIIDVTEKREIPT